MWKVVGASVTGSGHVRTGRACDDASLFAIVRDCSVDGALFIAVSDGAGSAPLSRLGSKCSVQTGIAVAKSVERSLRTVHEADLDVVASHVISRIQLELCHLARTVDEPLQSFACTVILVVIFDTHGLVLQVGDG